MKQVLVINRNFYMPYLKKLDFLFISNNLLGSVNEIYILKTLKQPILQFVILLQIILKLLIANAVSACFQTKWFWVESCCCQLNLLFSNIPGGFLNSEALFS